MSRAAFTFKTKAELRTMGLPHIDAYIRDLRSRISALNGLPRKSTEKQLEMVERIRGSLASAEDDGDL